MGRPRECSGQKPRVKISWRRYSGLSKSILISSRTTWRSFLTSSESNLGRRTRSALRAFENHVLHKVGEAIFLGDLAAGAIADPDADGDGADVGHGLCDDHEAIAQRVAFNVPGVRGKSRHVYIVAYRGRDFQAGSKGPAK